MCGCVCDDLAVTVEDGRVREFSPPCPLADPWLLRHREHSQAYSQIDGQNVAYDQAIEHANRVHMLRDINLRKYSLLIKWRAHGCANMIYNLDVVSDSNFPSL